MGYKSMDGVARLGSLDGKTDGEMGFAIPGQTHHLLLAITAAG